MANESNTEDELLNLLGNSEPDNPELDTPMDDLLGDYDDIESIINSLTYDSDGSDSGDSDAGNSMNDGSSTTDNHSMADKEEKKKKKLFGRRKKSEEDENSEENAKSKKDKKRKRTQKAESEQSENKKVKKEKPKKVKNKKSKKSKEDSIDAAAILNETGSTSEDMEGFDMEAANSLLNEINDFNHMDDLSDRDSMAEQVDEYSHMDDLTAHMDDIDHMADLDHMDGLDHMDEDELERQREKERQDKKEQKKKEKAEKKAQKEKAKKEKKAQKEKEKKAKPKKVKKPKPPRMPEEKIRVSPVGLLFVLTIVVVVVFGIYFGSQYFTYTSNVKSASTYYIDGKYEKAYDALAGVNIKDADAGLYNQVINIMRVKKHINDFDAFIFAGKYASALEALFRGIESYDESIMDANELGTTEILNSVLSDIDSNLRSYYNISVDEAREILQKTSREQSEYINGKAVSIVLPAVPEESDQQEGE